MDKEKSSNNTEENTSQKNINETNNQNETPKKKEKVKTNKKPFWKKLLSVLSSIFLTVLLLDILLFSAFFYSKSSKSLEYFFTTLFTLVIILLIPKTSKIFDRVTKNSSEKKKKIFKIVKITFFVFRGQLILAIIGFNVILGLGNNGRAYRDIFEHFGEKIVLPISSKEMNKLLELIEKDRESASIANTHMRRFDKYERRVNISKLAAHNIKFSYDRAKQQIEKNNIEEAFKEIDQALTLFSVNNFLNNLDSTKLDTLTLFTYISPDVLYNISTDYLKWNEKQSGSQMGIISSIALLFNPNHPQLTLLTANKQWNQLDLFKAKETYRKYINDMEQGGDGSDIPEDIKKIVNFEPGFSKKKMLTVYEWILQKQSSGMYDYNISDLSNEYSYFADFIKMFTQTNNNESNNYINTLKSISGHYVYSKRAGNTGVEINSNFVTWAKNNLIPSPNSKIGRTYCSEIYNNYFKNTCRAYASAYLYLDSQEGGFDQQVQDLHYAMENPNFYGLKYYYNTYRRIWPKNSGYSNGNIYTIFGWWLRRGAGGSAKEFWNALEKILLEYDSEWYNKATNYLSSVIGYTSSGQDYFDGSFQDDSYDEYGEDYEEGDGEYEDESGVYYSTHSSPISGIELVRFIFSLYEQNAFSVTNIEINNEDCKNDIEYYRFRNALTKSLVYYTFANIVNLQLPANKFSYITYVNTNNNQHISPFKNLFGDLTVEQAREEFPPLIDKLSNDDKKNLHKLSFIAIQAYNNYQNNITTDDENCYSSNELWDDIDMNIQNNKRNIYFTQFENNKSYIDGFWKRRIQDGTIDQVYNIMHFSESLLRED